jgi:hypothetical protein
VLSGRTPTLEDGWPAWAADRTDHVARIAARAVAALRT